MNTVRELEGTLFNERSAVYSSAKGRLGCAAIITAIVEDKHRYIVPRSGDRIFGMAQDYQMVFFFPLQVDSSLDGLRMTHIAGVRYPSVSFFDFEGTFPAVFQEQAKIWEKGGEL